VLNIDIRNQQNLLESLEQYVKGDLLEGANAYHCEKCNKKVRSFISPTTATTTISNVIIIMVIMIVFVVHIIFYY